MSSSTQPNSAPQRELWTSLAPYVVPPAAAAVAIVPTFYDMIAKSALQQGLQPPTFNLKNVVQAARKGAASSHTVGFTVGLQVLLQEKVQQTLQYVFPSLLAKDSTKDQALLTLGSSCLVGALSSPFLAIYNGKTMNPPWTAKESWNRFSLKQAGAISLQETGFVAGLAAADLTSALMKPILGDTKGVDYAASAIAGAVGSLAGHAGNSALTRWQNNLTVDTVRQLSFGALRKARGNAIFAVVYKLGKDILNTTVENKQS